MISEANIHREINIDELFRHTETPTKTGKIKYKIKYIYVINLQYQGQQTLKVDWKYLLPTTSREIDI